jgi:hypothetical protein
VNSCRGDDRGTISLDEDGVGERTLLFTLDDIRDSRDPVFVTAHRLGGAIVACGRLERDG